MNIDFIPKLRGKKERADLHDKVLAKIEYNIRERAKRQIKAMSPEELIENHFVAILPEIPKTKKGIDQAIDNFIKDMKPEKDNGEEILLFLGFFDSEEGKNEPYLAEISKYLKNKVKSKEEGGNIAILTPTEEVVRIIREYLQKATTQELFNLWIFGIVVSEEEAKQNIDFFINQSAHRFKTLYYIFDKHQKIDDYTEEDIAEANRNMEILNNEYEKQSIAYSRALKMISTNNSHRAVLSIVDKILEDGDNGY